MPPVRTCDRGCVRSVGGRRADPCHAPPVVLGVPVKTAVGVALFNSIFIAIPSCIGYSLQCDPKSMAVLLAVSMASHGAGVWAGSRNTSFLKPEVLKKAVAVFSVCIALYKLGA